MGRARYKAGTANLDFSEDTVTSQHNPIQNGQGILPLVHAQEQTNADGSQANTDFSPQTITSQNMNKPTPTPPHVGTLNHVFSTPKKHTLNNSVNDFGFSQNIQDVGGKGKTLGFEIQNMNIVEKKKNIISSGGKINAEQYANIIENQKIGRKTNVSVHDIGSLKRPNIPRPQHTLSASDFFKGVKSGNNPIQIDTGTKQKDGSKSMVDGYGDVTLFSDDTFGDMGSNFMGEPISNEKKNKKAFQDQFDLYSRIGNF